MSEAKITFSQPSMSGSKRKKGGLRASGMKRVKSKSGILKSPAAFARKGHEVKTVDVNLQTTTPSTTMAIVLLNGTTEGTDAVNRIGRRINMRSVRVRMSFQKGQQPTAATTPDEIRYALVYDRQPNGAAPTYSDIFQNIDKGLNAESGIYSNPNPVNFDRFIILREGFRSYVQLTTASVATEDLKQESGNGQNNTEEWFVRLKDLEANYVAGAGAGTVADLRSGALWMLFLSNVAAANQGINCKWTARLRFNDV